MRAADVPAELIELLDHAAGRQHSRDGRVVGALAEILTRYDELRARDHVHVHGDSDADARGQELASDPTN